MGNVLPGIVGALVGLIGVLVGAWTTSRHQDRSWLREQKLKGATDFITAGTHLYESQLDSSDQRRLTEADRVAWQDRLQAGRTHIHLLCREETRQAADNFSHLVWRTAGTRNVPAEDDVVAALKTFTDHLRREVHVDR